MAVVGNAIDSFAGIAFFFTLFGITDVTRYLAIAKFVNASVLDLPELRSPSFSSREEEF